MELPTAASGAARRLNTAAAILASGVLTDSAAEHYRAGFHNRAMYIAPIVAAAVLATTTTPGVSQRGRASARTAVRRIAVLTGFVGLGFHLTNTSRRIGGWNSPNVLFGAPIAAPLAITMAGLLGTAGHHIESQTPVRSHLAILVSALSALGLIATSTEAAALHFRGAFQNPFMFAPVVAPPVAAAALAGATFTRSHSVRRAARALLRFTSVLGLVGVGFHAWGVHRRMGGWRNWRQNLLAGPPLPAPPAFTGLALAGLASLDLLESGRRR